MDPMPVAIVPTLSHDRAAFLLCESKRRWCIGQYSESSIMKAGLLQPLQAFLFLRRRFIFAHRALCAAAIFLRAATDIVLLGFGA
jgi:hypothetical protein